METAWEICHPLGYMGSPSISRSRLDGLERAGKAFFQLKCDQALEADFDDVVWLSRMFAMRRNDIVHSVVKGVVFERSFRETELGPSWATKYEFYGSSLFGMGSNDLSLEA